MSNKIKMWKIPEVNLNDYNYLQNKIGILLDRLKFIENNYKNVIFASSLSVEDMVLTDLIATKNINIKIFTLDTLKLHSETLKLLDNIKNYYKIPITTYFPDKQEISEFEKKFGKNAIYANIELRKKCCYIRKISPLNKALMYANAWITGQRQEQSITRNKLKFTQLDKNRNIMKFNPIFDWLEQEIWVYAIKNKIPINELYTKGYPSIGCECCTIAVKLGENIRSGRWWWENQNNKECGLHQNN